MERVKETGIEITVKNAEGDPDTKATIIHQNSIVYEPKVSVIIPVYNTEAYLRECLDSVVNQTLKEIEIICVDDGSTDSSLEILKEYANKDNRFTIITQENLHAGVARNAGLVVARGEYLSFLDSDDYVKLEYLEKLYDKIVLEKADICICKRYILDSRTNKLKEDVNSIKEVLLPNKLTFSMYDISKNIFQFCEIAVWMKMYSRKFVQDKKILFQNTKTINDVYFNYLSLISAKKIAYVNDFLIIYRFFNKTSLTSKRGQDLDTLLHVYKTLIRSIKKIKVFNALEESLYNKLISSAKYEIRLCSDERKAKLMQKNLYKFLPLKYKKILSEIKKEKNKWYQQIFSVKNHDNQKHKQIILLGLKIKIKKKFKNIENNNLVIKTLKNKSNKINYFDFKTTSSIIRKNINKIPEDIDLIIGIPRSGVIPAYMIALFLNKRVCTLPEFLNNISPQNGRREIHKKNSSIKKILIVDDSIRTGESLKSVQKKLEKLDNIKSYDIKFLAIFSTKESRKLVDIYFKEIECPRLFQWNYLNHCISEKCCYDIDGVLCEDPTKEQNDDGEKYIDFIKNARPLYVPTYTIKAIVTSRLEKYRKETEEWLAKHNVKYEKLYMLNMQTAEERRKANCHAKFKADIYKSITEAKLFIESNPNQAKEIYNLTDKPVICVETDQIFQN